MEQAQGRPGAREQTTKPGVFTLGVFTFGVFTLGGFTLGVFTFGVLTLGVLNQRGAPLNRSIVKGKELL